MNPVGIAFAVAAVLSGTATLGAVVVSARWRAYVVGGLTAASGAAGALAGVAASAGHDWHQAVPQLLPLSGLVFAADRLSGWFLILVGVVTAIVGVYTTGYAGRSGRGTGSRGSLAVLPLFTLSLLAVPVAGSVPTFLLSWELMAVTSLLLVVTEHRHGLAVRDAGVWYAAMTQAGFVAVLMGMLWLAGATGSATFDGIRSGTSHLSGAVAGGVFILCLVGFASKAGAVPLHPWLPRAHAEAPSHVSALMSAAMVKLGIYGLIRVGFDLLGGGALWWWQLVGALGGLSALYGIVQAVVARDLKRLLAFTTTENVGLILLGIGFAGVLARSGSPVAAGLTLTAALLHAANHAAFKTLLFTGAGSAIRATGTRDLDSLGGLSRTMPATTVLVAIGALGAAALPPGNGFVSEWLLLQSLLHPGTSAGTLLTLAAPMAVAVVALTAGIGVATYVKVVGIGFLARPRSTAAAKAVSAAQARSVRSSGPGGPYDAPSRRAVEAPISMLVAMGVAATACFALAVVPAVALNVLVPMVNDLGVGPVPVDLAAAGVHLPGFGATLWPLWIAVGVVVATGAIAVTGRVLGQARRRAQPWDCGEGPLTSRMEYTATSFAEPLQRVFDDVLSPERDLDVTHRIESAYHVEAIRYHQRIPDRIENRLYWPLIRATTRLGAAARWLANGSVHRYLGYTLSALIVVLIAGVLR